MNRKRILLIIPATLLLYVVLLATAIMFSSTRVSIAQFIMTRIFGGSVLNLLLTLVVYSLFAIALSILGFAFAISGRWDAKSLAKTAMIIKLLQIPGYIVAFCLGVLFTLTIFTFLIALLFAFFGWITLVMSGLLTVAAAMNARNTETITRKMTFWTVLLQFFFCADVIATVVLYIKLRKQYRGASIENSSV